MFEFFASVHDVPSPTLSMYGSPSWPPSFVLSSFRILDPAGNQNDLGPNSSCLEERVSNVHNIECTCLRSVLVVTCSKGPYISCLLHDDRQNFQRLCTTFGVRSLLVRLPPLRCLPVGPTLQKYLSCASLL